MNNTLRGIIGLVVVAILLGGGTLIVRGCSSEKTPPTTTVVTAPATPAPAVVVNVSDELTKKLAERKAQIVERRKADQLRKELEKAEKELAAIDAAPTAAPAVEAPAKVVTTKVATRPAQTAPAQPATPQVINISLRQAQSQAQSGPGMSQGQGQEPAEGCEEVCPTGDVQAKPVSAAVLSGLLQDLAQLRAKILQQKEVARRARTSLESSRQSLRSPFSNPAVRASRQAEVERQEERLAKENLKLTELQEQEGQLREEVKKAGGN